MKTRPWLALMCGILLLALSERPAAAYYNPQTGRWLSRDPIGEKGGPNLQGFAANEGVGRIDILGMVFGVRYYTWDASRSHAWISTLIGSYGWYPTINWDQQTLGQKLAGVPGQLLSPDPHEFRISPILDGGKWITRIEVETKQKSAGVLKYGPKKGTRCKCLKDYGVTSYYVQLCVDEAARAQTGKWQALWGNCRDRAKKWLSECCMKLGPKEPPQQPAEEDHASHPPPSS